MTSPTIEDLENSLRNADREKTAANTTAAIYKLVDTFAGITQRKLWLKNGNTASTDGRQIIAPLASPDAYQLVEHELAHILFKSDPQARQRFIELWTKNIVLVAEQHKIHIRKELLVEALGTIINILEDHRVNSLWGVLYPGSFVRIRKLSQKACLDFWNAAEYNIAVYFLCMEVGMPADVNRFEKFREAMKSALRQVELRGFAATLAAAKWLIMQMVDSLIEATLPPALAKQTINDIPVRSEALERILHDFRTTPEEMAEQLGDVKEPSYPSYEEQDASLALAEKVLRTVADNLSTVAQNSAEEMRQVLNQVRQVIRNRPSPEQHLRKGAFAKVVFRDVSAKDLDPAQMDWQQALEAQTRLKRQIRATANAIKEDDLKRELEAVRSFLQHDAEDLDTVKRLRTVFHRAIGRRRASLDHEGTEVDPSAFIERRLSQEPRPCFRQQLPGRGYEAMILMDRSISMRGTKTLQTERACKILAQALRFPFVSLTIWGFQSMENGQIDVIRYDSAMKCFAMAKNDVGGGTPLHIATRLALRHLENEVGAKHLFILTDGYPSYANRESKIVPTARLMRWTRKEIRYGRNHGTNITGVLVGQRAGSKVEYDLTPEQMGFIFGPRKFWRFMDPTNLGQDLVRLVTTSFLNYVVHG